jgi:hypothetical protein
LESNSSLRQFHARIQRIYKLKQKGRIMPDKPKTKKSDLPQCKECGKVFDPEKQKLKSHPDYNRTAEGPICKDRPACRGRKLHAEYDKRGLKRWARRTQEQLLALMDCPPAGWENRKDQSEKWESVNDPPERVLAAIEFFSICYPICLLYAVQTDADGEPIKEMGEWKRHTHRTLAKVLGMDQPRVTRAIAHLRHRNLLETQEIDGETPLAVQLSPKLLNPLERDACTRISLQRNQQLTGNDEPALKLKHLAALPPRILNDIAELATIVQPEVRTHILQQAADACTRINRGISDVRMREADVLFNVIKPHLSLLSRYRDAEKAKSEQHAPPGRSPENPSREVNRRIPEPPAPPPAKPQNDGILDTIRSYVEAAWGSPLKTDDTIPTELLVATKKLRYPVRVLCLWIQAKGEKKASQGYAIDSPQFFVKVVERDLPVWAKSERLLVEQSIFLDQQAAANRKNETVTMIAREAINMQSKLKPAYRGDPISLENDEHLEVCCQIAEALADADVTEFCVHAMSKVAAWPAAFAKQPALTPGYYGHRWLGYLLELAKAYGRTASAKTA